MIKLESGAIFDKEFEPGDFVDGSKYHTRGLLMTFNPCRLCLVLDSCKKQTFTDCQKEYEKKWKEVMQ